MRHKNLLPWIMSRRRWVVVDPSMVEAASGGVQRAISQFHGAWAAQFRSCKRTQSNGLIWDAAIEGWRCQHAGNVQKSGDGLRLLQIALNCIVEQRRHSTPLQVLMLLDVEIRVEPVREPGTAPVRSERTFRSRFQVPQLQPEATRRKKAEAS